MDEVLSKRVLDVSMAVPITPVPAFLVSAVGVSPSQCIASESRLF